MDDKLAEIKQKFGVEEVRLVPGYPGYAVSSCGRVFSWYDNGSSRKGQLVEMNPFINKKDGNVRQVHLFKEGKRRLTKLARIVASAYLENVNNAKLVRHLDDNKANNHVSNLVWGTHKENMEDMVRNGGSLKGEASHRAKLTEVKVRDIKQGCQQGIKKQFYADKYSVSVSTIQAIISGRIWQHIKD